MGVKGPQRWFLRRSEQEVRWGQGTGGSETSRVALFPAGAAIRNSDWTASCLYGGLSPRLDLKVGHLGQGPWEARVQVQAVASPSDIRR